MTTTSTIALHLALASVNLHEAGPTSSPKQFSPVAKFRRYIPNRDKAFFDKKLRADGKITHWPHVPCKIPKRFKHMTGMHLPEMDANAIHSTPWDDDDDE